jgi:hypothetical protein
VGRSWDDRGATSGTRSPEPSPPVRFGTAAARDADGDTVGRVPAGRHQQGDVIVLAGVVDDEPHRNRLQERRACRSLPVIGADREE